MENKENKQIQLPEEDLKLPEGVNEGSKVGFDDANLVPTVFNSAPPEVRPLSYNPFKRKTPIKQVSKDHEKKRRKKRKMQNKSRRANRKK